VADDPALRDAWLARDAESDADFVRRHPDSRLGAWASEQGEPIASCGSERSGAMTTASAATRLMP
jgi:pyridoxine/pyridoxamine 5'-phosphate oxidase